MPSPLAHTLIGYIIYRKRGEAVIRHDAGRLLVLLQVLVVEDMGRYHNHFSHSLLFGVAVALVVMLLAGICRARRPGHWFLLALVSYWLHILMDWMTPGRGVMLFWPFTQQRFSSPVTLFYGLHWSKGLFSIDHVWTVLTEGLFIAVVLLVWHFAARWKNRKVSP
jgi:inner membrane protein